jgi:hypothetical protein
MESSSAVLGDLDLVAKKNSGSDRPAGSGDQGNQIPKDVILMGNDRPCADEVGKTNLNDFRGTNLSPKVMDESGEDLQPSGKNARISGSNSSLELLGTGEGDRLQACQTPQSRPVGIDFNSEDGLCNPLSKAGSSSSLELLGSGGNDMLQALQIPQSLPVVDFKVGSSSSLELLGSGGNDRLQALQIPQSCPVVRDLNSEVGLANPLSNADEANTSVLPGSGSNSIPLPGLLGLPCLMKRLLIDSLALLPEDQPEYQPGPACILA